MKTAHVYTGSKQYNYNNFKNISLFINCALSSTSWYLFIVQIISKMMNELKNRLSLNKDIKNERSQPLLRFSKFLRISTCPKLFKGRIWSLNFSALVTGTHVFQNSAVSVRFGVLISSENGYMTYEYEILHGKTSYFPI